jgi:hypothetical protein
MNSLNLHKTFRAGIFAISLCTAAFLGRSVTGLASEEVSEIDHTTPAEVTANAPSDDPGTPAPAQAADNGKPAQPNAVIDQLSAAAEKQAADAPKKVKVVKADPTPAPETRSPANSQELLDPDTKKYLDSAGTKIEKIFEKVNSN